MIDEKKLEFKLGIFVFLGIFILAIFVFSIGDFKIWQRGYIVNVDFGFLNGVKLGAPVRFRGVDVGEVRAIEIIESDESKESKVRVSCWIKNSVKIPSDVSVWVNTLGLLGEKYIEIMPGKNNASFLKPHACIKGNDPIAMHELGLLAKELISDLEAIILKLKNREGSLANLIYEDSLYKKIENIISNLETLSNEIRLHPWKLLYRPKEKRR
ncbi:MAG: MlaD family protein [Candidatus Omnitrophica bacterium]|nr:MlaD family protein [Candidatus Omnitrophota bacterium]